MTLERFKRLVEDTLGDLGTWKVRQVSKPYDSVLLATLRGTNGHVEVWDGYLHRQEVWFIGKDKTETAIATDCGYLDGPLRDAVLQACNLAGIQQRLDLGAEE